MQLEFANQSIANWVLLLAAGLAAIALWLYHRELMRQNANTPWGYIAALLRSGTIFLLVLMLAEPSLLFVHVQGQPSNLLIAIDASQSMERIDALGKTRWHRATELLQDAKRFPLQQLATQFNIQILRTDGVLQEQIFASKAKSFDPANAALKIDELNSFSNQSALGDIVSNSNADAIVLLTDGSSNSGLTLIQAAEQVAKQTDVSFIKLVDAATITDPRILAVDSSEQAARDDSLAGQIVFDLDGVEGATLEILHQDRLVWNETLDSASPTQRGQTALPFSFPLAPIIDAALKEKQSQNRSLIQEQAVALEFTARLNTNSLDAEPRNNLLKFRVWVRLVQNRLLLVENGPRWETRYIRNALQRDFEWQIDPVILEQDDSESIKILDAAFENLDALSRYDVIIFGDIPAINFSESRQALLEQYVSQAGGGLIFIAGGFGYLQNDNWTGLKSLLPIEPLSEVERRLAPKSAVAVEWNAAAMESEQFTLTQLPANFINRDGQTNANIAAEQLTLPQINTAWRGLPELFIDNGLSATPTATVLASGTAEGDVRVPLFIEQRVGAGRVFYSSTDQTWKWRYEQADQVHRRFWTQVCRQYARKPYLIHSDRFDVDVAGRTYAADAVIAVRVRLQPERFAKVDSRLVFAVLESVETGQRHKHLLAADATLADHFGDSIASPGVGHYHLSIETEGLTADEQKIYVDVFIASEDRTEILSGRGDEAAMEQAAKITGGVCVSDEDNQKLIEHLRSVATGQTTRDSFQLWTSYWWFVPLICFLGGEWWLRKKLGLL